MTDWGPGAGGGSLSDSESDESEEDQDASGETPSAQERDEPPQKKTAQEWRMGSVDDVLRPGEYAFLPVFGFNEGHVAVCRFAERTGEEEVLDDDPDEEEPTRVAGKELSWWEDESIMPKHPFMLINPVGFTTADADRRDFRDVFRMQKGDTFVFSDSGGYQLMSMDDAEIVDSVEEHEFQDLRVYPERLVEWQVMNADAGATIDFPPYNISGDANFPDSAEWGEEWADFFVERRDKSEQMTERMASHLAEMRDQGIEGARDYIFSPVIHGKPYPDGETHHLVRSWHESMEMGANKGGVEPDGWVVKPEPSHNFGQIALHLGYAAEHLQDVDYLHVLMVGGLLQKTLLMYYAREADHMVTSDASSYAAGGKRRQFDLPKTARRRSVIISNRTDEEREDATMDATRLDRYPCRCQVCATVEREHGFDFVTTGTGSARNATLNLHNLHQALSIERTLDALLRESDEQIVETGGKPTGAEFWRFLDSIAQDKRIEDLYRAMDYIRLAQQEGLARANQRYRILWDASGGKTILPASGSGADW